MPRTINPIRKARLKKELKKSPENIKEALLKAGYTATTAHNSSNNKCVEVCQAEIVAELKHSDITPDLMIKHFTEDRTLALAKGDLSTATRVDELMSKSIAMLTDKSEVSQTLVIKADEKEELNRLRGKVFSNPICTN